MKIWTIKSFLKIIILNKWPVVQIITTDSNFFIFAN